MNTSGQTKETADRLNPVIKVHNFVKRYDDFVAVDKISFEIKEGEIFGLIGPDGAGKTSTFHVMGGVMDATEGDISILGQTPRLARKQIGYLTQQFSLHLDLSLEENLKYSAGIREVSEDQYRKRSEYYLKLMDLYRFKTRLAGQLSGGMKQKLALCCALVSAPKILLLDEPTTGVDPVSRREFWDVLAAVANEGVTTAVATPYLDEAERCNRVALINKGKIAEIGSPRELIANLGMERLEIHSDKLDELERTLRELAHHNGELIADIQEFGDRLDVLSPMAEKAVEAIRQNVQDNSLRIQTSHPSLENVFVSHLRSASKEKEEKTAFTFERKKELDSSKTAIGAKKISIHFGTFKAVKSVSLDIKYGEIYGLLGANGAGKTTTIKMLCGLLTPSQGEMILAGEKSDLRKSSLRRRIGYMSQKFTLYDDLTVEENLKFYCGVYGVPHEKRTERIKWVLESCGLEGQENLITKTLPGGWKQRLSFGACVMHQPEILFLDEPTSGVDPLARRQLWRQIRDFAKHGTAVLVTTHFLEEAEHCQRMAFMVSGEIVAEGSPSEIKQSQPGKLVELVTNYNQKAAQVLRERMESWKISIFADSIHVNVANDNELEAVRSQLQAAGIAIESSRSIDFSLEDSFIGIVMRASQKASQKDSLGAAS